MTNQSVQLFYKHNKRYYPWGNGIDDWHSDHDALKIGEFRLISCPSPGTYREQHIINPDHATFIAASEIAREAMEQAILEMAKASPSLDLMEYSPMQKELIEKFRSDMATLGALVPTYWRHSSPFEIAKAGIDAVKEAMLNIDKERESGQRERK